MWFCCFQPKALWCSSHVNSLVKYLLYKREILRESCTRPRWRAGAVGGRTTQARRGGGGVAHSFRFHRYPNCPMEGGLYIFHRYPNCPIEGGLHIPHMGGEGISKQGSQLSQGKAMGILHCRRDPTAPWRNSRRPQLSHGRWVWVCTTGKTPNCPHKRFGCVNSPWKDPYYTVKGVKRGNGKDRKECVTQINIKMFINFSYRNALQLHGPWKRANIKRVGTEV